MFLEAKLSLSESYAIIEINMLSGNIACALTLDQIAELSAGLHHLAFGGKEPTKIELHGHHKFRGS